MRKFALLLLLLIVALGFGTIFLYTDTFVLNEIDIESGWIPKQDILEAASLSLGQNLFFLNKIDLVDKIKEDPRVDEIEFKKVYPEKLLIRIKPKQPEVSLEYRDRQVLLDKNKFALAQDFEFTGLPKLKNFATEDYELGDVVKFKNEKLFENALDLAQLCQQADFYEIIIWEENGFIFLHLDEGFKASFGKGDEIERKFNNFYAIYSDLREKSINRGTINLTNPETPTFLPFD